MKLVMTGAALTMLAGCATTGTPGPPRSVETIRYETGPCFGACPVYAVMVSSDGKGTFEGKRFTTVTGERAFAVTPAQFADFRKRLAPYRPANGERRIESGSADCGAMITDQASVSVSWQGGGAPPAGLSLYYGCTAPDLVAMKHALRGSVDALPVAALIARR